MRRALLLLAVPVLLLAAAPKPSPAPTYTGPPISPPRLDWTEPFDVVLTEHGITEATFAVTPTSLHMDLSRYRIVPGDRIGYECAFFYLVSDDATPVEAVVTITYIDPNVVVNDRGMPEYDDGPDSPSSGIPREQKKCPPFVPPVSYP